MRNLEKAIKSNWHPQKSDISKSVEILFEIKRNGDINFKKVLNSSGDNDFDENAISAIKKTGKYKPIPSEYKGDSVPAEFTFDYSVESFAKDTNNI